jgi:hypothetical protein
LQPKYIPTIDRDALESVANRAGRDGEPADLLLERDADGIPVVLAHEDDRQLVHTGEVHGLVDLSLVSGPFAEVRDRHDVVAAHPGTHRDPDRVQHLRAHR